MIFLDDMGLIAITHKGGTKSLVRVRFLRRVSVWYNLYGKVPTCESDKWIRVPLPRLDKIFSFTIIFVQLNGSVANVRFIRTVYKFQE